MGRVHGTSCGQGVSEAHGKMRTFLCIVLTAADMADSEPYTIGQVAHGYGRGVITGVDYGYGHVSGYGAIGNRGYAGYGGYAGYSGLHGFYGKREADSDSDAYTIGQVAHGHAYGVVTGVDYGHGRVSGYGAIGNRGYAGYGGYAGYAGIHAGYGGVYGGYSGHYGKREADSDAYTIGQIAYGLPQANAYATGHPHNVGVITGYGGYAG